MNERDLIDRLRPLAGPAGLNLEDDAAVLRVGDKHDLIVSTDTMVEGVHFPAGRIGGGFAERLLRTALSDLAAKGARPIGYGLNMTWPQGRETHWIDGFVRGLAEAQAAFDCPLIGGDTTTGGALLIGSATVYGLVPRGTMVTRAGARPGDRLWHTGVLGRAEIGLSIVTGKCVDVSPDEIMRCEDAYLRPVPRIAFRKALRQFATACADISDGLLSEAGHIAGASGVRIDVDRGVAQGAGFGDDYELLFTAPLAATDSLLTAADRIGLPLTRCGNVRAGEGVWVDGRRTEPAGYRHRLTD